MCTIAGTFKVVQLGLDQDKIDRLAAELGLTGDMKKKLAGGSLFVEKIPTEEYTVKVKGSDKVSKTKL